MRECTCPRTWSRAHGWGRPAFSSWLVYARSCTAAATASPAGGARHDGTSAQQPVTQYRPGPHDDTPSSSIVHGSDPSQPGASQPGGRCFDASVRSTARTSRARTGCRTPRGTCTANTPRGCRAGSPARCRGRCRSSRRRSARGSSRNSRTRSGSPARMPARTADPGRSPRRRRCPPRPRSCTACRRRAAAPAEFQFHISTPNESGFGSPSASARTTPATRSSRPHRAWDGTMQGIHARTA